MYFYIGFPRTGTTYLQSLFYRHPEIQYFHKTRRIYYGIQYDDILDSKRVNLEGDESLSTHMYCDVKKKLKRIKEIDSNAKIIISLRKQSEALKSYYHHQILRDKSVYNFRTFLNTPKGSLHYKSLDYFTTVNECYRLFGKERVLVCLYDSLVKNGNEYLKMIDQFLGLTEGLGKYDFHVNGQKINQSLSQFSINILKFLNFVYSKTFQLLKKDFEIKESLQKDPSLKKQNFLLDGSGYLGTKRYHQMMSKYFLSVLDTIILRLVSKKFNTRFLSSISKDPESIISDFQKSNTLLSELINIDLIRLWY